MTSRWSTRAAAGSSTSSVNAPSTPATTRPPALLVTTAAAAGHPSGVSTRLATTQRTARGIARTAARACVIEAPVDTVVLHKKATRIHMVEPPNAWQKGRANATSLMQPRRRWVRAMACSS